MKKYDYFEQRTSDTTDFKILDEDFGPVNKTDIITEINNYLGDPILTKTQNNYTTGTPIGLYQTEIASNLCNENRYIIAMVKEVKGLEVPIGTSAKLSSIKWNNLQTKTVRNSSALCYNKTSHTPTKKLEYVFSLVGRGDKTTKYSHKDLPIKLELVNSKSKYEYADRVRLDGALDSFNCSITRL